MEEYNVVKYNFLFYRPTVQPSQNKIQFYSRSLFINSLSARPKINICKTFLFAFLFHYLLWNCHCFVFTFLNQLIRQIFGIIRQ